MRHGPGLALATASVVGFATAQAPQWYAATVAVPAPHDGGAIAYDSVRDRVVLAGGADSEYYSFPAWFADTWEWGGAHWIQRTAAACPQRYGHQLAYDPHRQRMVMWGGAFRSGDTEILQVSTFEYDGSAWHLAASTGPTPRTGHVMTYDPVLQRVLMFGGYGNATWAWDGAAWTVVNAPAPPGRRYPAAAYDTIRNRWVVFGGRAISNNSLLADLWEWDGVAWTLRTPSASPPAVLGSMAFDPRRGVAVLSVGNNTTADLWEWNGVAWTHALARSSDHALGPAVWHAGTGAVAFVGPSLMDTWDGANLVPLPAGYPQLQTPTAMATLGQQLLLVTPARVWQWGAGEWRAVGGAFPGLHDDELMVVEDTVRNRLVCVVPHGALGSYVNEWDGAAWNGPIGGARVPTRRTPAVAFDRAHGRTVLFGGYGIAANGVMQQDTWEWQLGLWTQRTPATQPSPRFDAAMAWDPQRGEVLLFGGATAVATFSYLTDTWSWNGTDWSQLAPATPPPALPMTMLLHEGEGRPYLLARTAATPGSWSWNGADWQAAAIPWRTPVAFDRGRGQFVSDGVMPTDVVPRFFGAHVAPSVTSSGAPCGASPQLQLSIPFLGNPALAFDVSQTAPGAVGALVLGTQLANTALPGGCTAFVGGATSTRFFLLTGGFASLHVAVPAASALLGASLQAQAFTLDLATAAIAASGARALTVGN